MQYRLSNGFKTCWSLLGLVLMVSLLCASVTEAMAEDQLAVGATPLFVTSIDFPPDPEVQLPVPAKAQTYFYKLLDRDLTQMSSPLALTNRLDVAQYQVTLNCTGVMHCAKLRVVVSNPRREVLTTYQISARPNPLKPLPLENVSKNLAQTLTQRISELGSGGTGSY
jgi:hypothetical protein